MGGHVFSHKRAEHFLFPCRKLLVIGHDTKHVMGEHPLWRQDCNHIPDESFVASIRKHGFLQPVRARKLPKSDGIESDHIDLAADEFAEVVMGRERVKAGRILEDEGTPIFIPTLLWPAGTPLADIIGAANAENFQRKTESAETTAEHVYMQLRAEGYFDGVDELLALKSVGISTGLSVQRIRNLLAFREDDRLVRAFRSGIVKSEAALAIAMLPEAERGAELEKIAANPELGTVAQVRERVGFKNAALRAERAEAETAENTSPKTKTGAKRAKGTGSAVGTREVHNGASGPVEPALGLSKALQRRIVAEQMGRAVAERDLDPLVLKTVKVLAGLAPPSSVPGFVKALKALGL